MDIFTKRLILIVALCVTIAILALFWVGFNKRSDDRARYSANGTKLQRQEEPVSQDLSSTDPEERNPLLSKAGLPYENDQYAIAYRLNDDAPYGVVLKVIDKTGEGKVSQAVRNEALDYLAERGIQPNSIKIEYEYVQ